MKFLKNPSNKSNKVLKEMKKNQKRRESKKKKRYEISLEEQDYLDKVGHEIADSFTLTELKEASAGKGYKIHGFLQKKYLDYEYLIDRYILDRAVYFAEIEQKAEIIKFIDTINLNGYHKSIVIPKEPFTLETFPDTKISKILVWSKVPISDAVIELDNCAWELDGYDTTIIRSPINLSLLAFLFNEYMLCVNTYSPGKNMGIDDVKLEVSTAVKELEQFCKDYVYELRQHEIQMKNQLEEKDIELQVITGNYERFKKRTLEKGFFGTEIDIQKFESQGRPRPTKKRRIKQIIYGLLIVLGIGAFFLIFQMLNSPAGIFFTNSTGG